MKTYILILLLFCSFTSFSQQSISSKLFFKTHVAPANKIDPKDNFWNEKQNTGDTSKGKEPATNKSKSTLLGIYGVGNLNTEAFNAINSSGKLSLFVKPLSLVKDDITVYLSFNKNATNNDTLLASTLIFPEVGNHSFLGTLDYSHLYSGTNNDSTNHALGAFAEFSYKKIKKEIEDDKSQKLEKRFSTLNYTIGLKYSFRFTRLGYYGSLSFSPYISWFNIPDEDSADFRAVASKNFKPINNHLLTDHFKSFGLKTTFQINDFAIFADFRQVVRKDDLSVRELRGFNANIGVVFNAKIFEL